MEIGSLVTPLGKTKFFWFGSGAESVMIISGIHGDEHNSILAVKRLIVKLKKTPKAKFNSRVIVVPVANPNAFKFKRRTSMIDNLDLNRVFPGDSEGFATERHAAALWGIARSVDYIIDVHTCGFCEEYILTLYKEYPKVSNLVSAISIHNVVESTGLRGQLFVEALKEGIQAAIIELPQEYFRINPKIVERASTVLYQALINIEAIDGEKTNNIEHEFFGKIIRHHSDEFGFYKPKFKLGANINKGDILGFVGKSPVKARASGKLISQKPIMLVQPGEILAGVVPKNRS